MFLNIMPRNARMLHFALCSVAGKRNKRLRDENWILQRPLMTSSVGVNDAMCLCLRCGATTQEALISTAELNTITS